MKKILLLISVLLLTIVGTGFAQDGMLPDLIEAENPGMHPEGIEWDGSHNQFLVGSLGLGTVFAVADDGTVTSFAESESLVSSIGIHIDHSTHRLLVANADPMAFTDPSVDGIAQLGIFDLETGKELHFVELGELYPDGRHFANDVTSDPDGNAYVTDTFSPVIYKVDVDGNAEIFAENEAFANANGGLNGIDYHPDGYLLVAVAGAAQIYKVPVDDPSTLTMVELSEPLAIDGMIVNSAYELVAVATTFDADGNAMSEVLTVYSEDDWATAEVTGRAVAIPPKNPTTVAIRDNNAFVVHANFGALFAGQLADSFEIMRLDLTLEEHDMMDDSMDDDMSDDSMSDDDMGDDMMATEEAEG